MKELRLPKSVIELINGGRLYVSINMDGDEAEERDYCNCILFRFIDNQICDECCCPICDIELNDIDLKYFCDGIDTINEENFARPLMEYVVCKAYEDGNYALKEWEDDDYPIWWYAYKTDDEEIIAEECELDIPISYIVG